MFDLKVSTMIDAPIRHVFEYMSAPENDFQWQYGTLATATVPNRQNRMGLYFRSIGHLMGRRNLGTYEVIEYILNMAYKFRSLSGPLRSRTLYAFETTDEGTRVTISIQVGAVKFIYMNERVLEIRMKKQLKENLAMLKKILEVKPLPAFS